MKTRFRKTTLLSLAGTALLLSGCATTDSVQRAQHTADHALSVAQHAQKTADHALSTAQNADKTAKKALSWERMMPHQGPRG